jgi:predicted nucleic acid-binding protein
MGSGLDAFSARIAGERLVAVDTCACIYFLSQEAQRFALTRHLFSEAIARRRSVLLAGIVQLELLVRPFRRGDDFELSKVMRLTERTPGVRLTDMTRDTLVTAARVRAAANLRAPDAMVVASAALSGCSAIVGNDKAFRRIAQIDPQHWFGAKSPYQLPAYIHLDDYIDAA